MDLETKLELVLPTIETNTNIEGMANAAIEALAGRPLDLDATFQRGGNLVHIVKSEIPEEEGTFIIRLMAPPTLRERMATAAQWIAIKLDKKTEKVTRSPCKPPADVVAAVEARGQWKGIPHLVGIVGAPVLRRDGTVLQDPGYDPSTGLYYIPSQEFARVPDDPTYLDALDAAEVIAEVICDAPFELKTAEDGTALCAGRSVYLAALLTTFARPAIRGCVPFFAFDASTRGSGKGLLIDTIGVIATGRKVPRTPMPTGEEELRKKITSLMIEGRTFVHWDNISAALGGDNLESLATTEIWQDRILGVNSTPEWPNRLINFASGNNLSWKGDFARRVLPCRLVPKTENPEDRTDFKHKDLLAWVGANRGRLVGAVLTILRANKLVGKSPEGTYGSFEAWYELVVGAIRWLGWDDPMEVRKGIEDSGDGAKQALIYIVENWQATFGQKQTTTRDIAKRLDERDATDMKASFAVLLEDKPVNPRNIGYALRSEKDRVIKGRSIKEGTIIAGSNTWKCEKVA